MNKELLKRLERDLDLYQFGNKRGTVKKLVLDYMELGKKEALKNIQGFCEEEARIREGVDDRLVKGTRFGYERLAGMLELQLGVENDTD